MSKNDFVLVFQYDEDEADTRSPDKRIPRMCEAQGGSLVDVTEAYGQVDVTCNFTGTPEEVTKLVNAILNSYTNTVKMSQITTQSIYNLVVENGNVDNPELMTSLKDLVRSSPLSKVHQHPHNENDLMISIAIKEEFEELKGPLKDIVKKFIPEAMIYEEKGTRKISESNNYTEKKKYSL